MNKKDLEEYQKIGLRISALKDRIDHLKEVAAPYEHGVVKGSAREFPYQPKNFHVSGYNITEEGKRRLKICGLQERLQKELQEEESRRLDVEEFINSIQDRTDNLIFTYYYLDKMNQEEIAKKLCMDQSRVSRRIRKYFKDA